jgi:hypothetical protein
MFPAAKTEYSPYAAPASDADPEPLPPERPVGSKLISGLGNFVYCFFVIAAMIALRIGVRMFFDSLQ